MFLIALAYVLTYGANVPVADDWMDTWLLPVGKGEPVTLSWLWSVHVHSHRCPLPRLLLLGLYGITGDIRSVMAFHVLLVGALTFALIRTAQRLRGRLSYTDAFFPLALLNLGHYDPMLRSNSIAITVVVFLMGVLLLIIVASHPRPHFGGMILAGVCLVLLPLVNAAGMLVLPMLALWLGYVAMQHRLAGGLHARRESLLILSLTGAAALLIPFYLLGLPSAKSQMLGAGLLTIPQSCLQLMGLGTFGATMRDWPRAGRAAGQLAGTALLLVSIAALVPTLLRQPAERPRALGLLAFQGAMMCLTLGLSVGRALAVVDRYALFYAPGLCGLYFIWLLYGPPGIRRSTIIMALFLSQLALVFPEFRYGVSIGRYQKYRMAAFERDLQSGMPTYMLLGRHSKYLFPSPKFNLQQAAFQGLRAAGFGSFRFLRGDTEFREVPLPLDPVVVHDISWEGGIMRVVGDDPYLMYELPDSRFIGGVRLKYSCEAGKRGTANHTVWIACKQGDSEVFTVDRTRIGSLNCLGSGEGDTTIWVGAQVKQFRISLGRKERDSNLRVSGITLLLPVREDRFTAQAEDPVVPRVFGESRFNRSEALRSVVRSSADQWPVEFTDRWPVDHAVSVPVFLHDVLFGVRP
jgi:hypothetical protein